jgi:hypothetical protein
MPDRYETKWEQGFVLTADAAAALGISHESGDETVVILASHDCDVLDSSDKSCEIVVGKVIDQADGSLTNAKNPRRLHLTFSAGSTKIIAEVHVSDKRVHDKERFLQQAYAEGVRLTPEEHLVLQRWLSKRYHRPIFPDAFDSRLKAKPAEMHKRIANTLKSTGTDVVAIMFDVDDGVNVEREGPNDVYSLEVFVVWNVMEDPARAEATAKDIANRIRTLMRQYFFKNRQWENIEIKNCVAISEDALTLYSARRMKPWETTYLEVLTV